MISKYYGTYSATDHTATELQNKKNLTNLEKEIFLSRYIPVLTVAIHQPKKLCYAQRFYGILEILQSF